MDLHETNSTSAEGTDRLMRAKTMYNAINNSVASESVHANGGGPFDYQHSPVSHQSDLDSPKELFQ